MTPDELIHRALLGLLNWYSDIITEHQKSALDNALEAFE